MVARLVKSSAKLVTQTLTGVGFEVEWRWVAINHNGETKKKRSRAYCIPDSQTWTEIVSRYYYSEDSEKPQMIPEVLKSQRFYRVTGVVPSVPSVASAPENNDSETGGTLGTPYSTRHGNNGNKPTDPCIVCGANDWWRRNGSGWLCGCCHPDSPGEMLFRLDSRLGGVTPEGVSNGKN